MTRTLWTRYRDRGLLIIGVPSNDFGGQEPKMRRSARCRPGSRRSSVRTPVPVINVC
jgi:hypothetical protein